MKKKNETSGLKETIALLENKQTLELKLLKEEISDTIENLKPINLIKSTFKRIVANPDLKDDILDNAIGLTTGYLSKKVLVGASHNPFKRIFGTLLQFAIANVVSNNTDKIKSTGEGLFKRIFKKNKKENTEFSSHE